MKLKKIPQYIVQLLRFLTEDIWRVIPTDISKKKQRGYNILKIIVIAIRRFQVDNLQRSASALTYSTFLALIPLLAVILSIAKGFGFRNIVESQIFEYFPGQREIFTQAFTFVDSYMEHTQDGIFLGIGLILLLYTVYNLISNIENNFNTIWQVPRGRSYLRRFTDYFSVFLLLPVFLVCSSGVSILAATTFGTLKEYLFFAPIYEILISVTPLVVTIIFFTALYMFMPNTRVRFGNALIAAVFAGIAFQLFQYLFISGQIWVSKYNAIYGGFALIPLLLLWMQLSWVICLIGAEIAYASQNVNDHNFEQDSKNISRRYLDFLILSVLTLIIKRFEKGERPYTATEISGEYKIPIRLTQRVLNILVELRIINELNDSDHFTAYQPALDINRITVDYLFSRIDRAGSENFRVDRKSEFNNEWQLILRSRKNMFPEDQNILVKDLKVEKPA